MVPYREFKGVFTGSVKDIDWTSDNRLVCLAGASIGTNPKHAKVVKVDNGDQLGQFS